MKEYWPLCSTGGEPNHYHTMVVNTWFETSNVEVITARKVADIIDWRFRLAMDVINSPLRSLHKWLEQKHSFTSIST